ncbi:hypothetical protein HMPREF1624_04731 [Sporothrix schenckii ATCC 58251]|uniref:Cupin 2 conserved barrel domain-containing protein n=1 Tax=Sporothrix schenckii (strain ATCC 58251 / de Perez 2211183) TaxID=1391915 RepID=U7PXR6_SPOS1|nr:hypothetical protein HMPREF1624_04731 [Sporothrix schenckii ATCC 58251]
MSKSSEDREAEVRSWGFAHVFTWTDGPNSYYRPHKHAGPTTHLILRGQLTIAYPDAPGAATKTTLGVGDRWDVPAGMSHEVWVGPEGCTYVIGE